MQHEIDRTSVKRSGVAVERKHGPWLRLRLPRQDGDRSPVIVGPRARSLASLKHHAYGHARQCGRSVQACLPVQEFSPHPGISPPGHPAQRIEPGWRRERASQVTLFDLARVGVPYQQISLMVDVAANGVRMIRRPDLSKLRPCGRETREIIPRHLAKSLLLTGVEGGHEMAREMRRQHPAVKSVALFIVEHRCKRL